MTLPPYEWPTRTAGLLTRPNVRFTVATSPSIVSRPYWAAITSCPSAWSAGLTLLKHEPSAQIPWQNTMLGLVFMGVISLEMVLPGRQMPFLNDRAFFVVFDRGI